MFGSGVVSGGDGSQLGVVDGDMCVHRVFLAGGPATGEVNQSVVEYAVLQVAAPCMYGEAVAVVTDAVGDITVAALGKPELSDDEIDCLLGCRTAAFLLVVAKHPAFAYAEVEGGDEIGQDESAHLQTEITDEPAGTQLLSFSGQGVCQCVVVVVDVDDRHRPVSLFAGQPVVAKHHVEVGQSSFFFCVARFVGIFIAERHGSEMHGIGVGGCLRHGDVETLHLPHGGDIHHLAVATVAELIEPAAVNRHPLRGDAVVEPQLPVDDRRSVGVSPPPAVYFCFADMLVDDSHLVGQGAFLRLCIEAGLHEDEKKENDICISHFTLYKIKKRLVQIGQGVILIKSHGY